MIFCSNCDNEAIKKVEHDDGSPTTFLCGICADAYEWGMAADRNDIVVDIDSELEEPNEP
jgi:hypothetical protein